MAKNKPGIKEIARRVNFSIATVSRAMNDATAPLVKASTRARIVDIAAKFNYTPHNAARSLRSKQTGTIGFLMNFETDTVSGYIHEILKGTLKTLDQTKRDIKLISAERFDSIDRIMRMHGLDGIILPHGYKEAFPNLKHESLEHSGKSWPVVLINDHDPSYRINQLFSNNYKASEFLTDYLIKKGVRSFFLISTDRGSRDAELRRTAFLRVLKRRRIKFDKNTDEANGHFQEEGGYAATLKLIRERSRFRGAIFCLNDVMAIGAIKAIGQAGLVCGKDISVVGFDGISTTEYTNPPLTTIKFELFRMGSDAVSIIDNIVAKRERQIITREYPFSLVERKSCK